MPIAARGRRHRNCVHVCKRALNAETPRVARSPPGFVFALWLSAVPLPSFAMASRPEFGATKTAMTNPSIACAPIRSTGSP
ncbi:hypothetical protein AQ611_22960 [Burkholderia singularis]|nr:hypothetical protein AQ611_22960 [Burkholderia sp. Bp7605]